MNSGPSARNAIARTATVPPSVVGSIAKVAPPSVDLYSPLSVAANTTLESSGEIARSLIAWLAVPEIGRPACAAIHVAPSSIERSMPQPK